MTNPESVHIEVEPKILYFGTPVVLVSTENADGSFNLAPISSAWALGRTLVLGLGADGHTLSNLRSRPELTINYPEPHLWPAVERLASLTGANPVPPTKPERTTFRSDKFAAARLNHLGSVAVRPPRVQECGIQVEAKATAISPSAAGGFVIVECEAEKIHARESLVLPDTQHIDPKQWEPLIYNFRHYFGLGRERGFSYRSETPGGSPRLRPDEQGSGTTKASDREPPAGWTGRVRR